VTARSRLTHADIADVISSMTLEEKLAQLVAVWPQGSGAPGEAANVAPLQDEMLSASAEFSDLAAHGLGQLTRPLGSRAGLIAERLEIARGLQEEVIRQSRFDIPALVHEECLTGLQLYGATTYPAPLAWGASWDVETVREMAGRIGMSMRELGIHLGLAPVLDVVRDPRWGRVEECISEDPYLVGTIGTAYVQGLQQQGPGATLKHFLGYSNSRAGRNLAPVHAGPRELAEVFAVPFEMVVKHAHPSAVMHSYAEIDGVPVASDDNLLTGLLRDRWNFDGIVVADYFGIAFLKTLHDIAADLGEAAATALRAGVDVELPAGDAYLEPLAARVRAGQVPTELVDGAVARVLRHKVDVGVFDNPIANSADIDLDPPESRYVARKLADESIVLLKNEPGVLPLHGRTRIAVIGPNADSPEALMGNYSFTNHIVVPDDTPLGITVPTVLEALRTELADTVEIGHALGCAVRADQESPLEATANIRAAAALAADADLCIAVVGDRAGVFGRGTVGEGSDTDELALPGRQLSLLTALVETGTPVVIVLITGRPYPLGSLTGGAAAIVQAFFPGEEGGQAIAGVLSGRLNPSGRLPVSIPKVSGGQPYVYRHPRLGGRSPVSNIDPSPEFPFGYGLSYTRFQHDQLEIQADRLDTSATLRVSCRVRNIGDREGADVVQLYVRDRVASVTRPLRQLLGWARVALEPNEAARVEFTVSADRLGFVGRDLAWRLEPGQFDFAIAQSALFAGVHADVSLGGPVRILDDTRELLTPVSVLPWKDDDAR
jgi:beta-glucosidase-like glycosyl hydrolase